VIADSSEGRGHRAEGLLCVLEDLRSCRQPSPGKKEDQNFEANWRAGCLTTIGARQFLIFVKEPCLQAYPGKIDPHRGCCICNRSTAQPEVANRWDKSYLRILSAG